MYMRTVDSYNNHLHVSCFMTASGAKFLLLHEKANEDSIKQFFNDTYEVFVKIVMNPFYDSTQPINIPQFDDTIAHIAQRCFL